MEVAEHAIVPRCTAGMVPNVWAIITGWTAWGTRLESTSMPTRIAVLALVLACGSLLVGSPQSDRTAAATKWTVSRTPDGHPDMQGMWTNYDATPFERLGPGEQFPRELAVSTADWLVQDSPISPRRTSMVVDPPN